jgi:hypothetical protein
MLSRPRVRWATDIAKVPLITARRAADLRGFQALVGFARNATEPDVLR